MPTRRSIAITTAFAAVIALLVSVAPAPRAEAATTDLLVGDSVMAGMSSSSRAGLPNHIFDAKVCRRLISTSCSYNGSRPSTALGVVQAYSGAVNRAIVVAVGYNDGSVGSAVDAIVAEARRQGVPHVVWLTYRIAGSHAGTYRNHNSVLWTKAAQYPELRIADWAAASAGRSDWVAADGLHLNSRGAAAMASLIGSTLASLAPPPPPPPTRCDLANGGSSGVPIATGHGYGPAAGIVLHDAPRRLIDTRSTDDGKVRAGRVLRVPIPAAIAQRASAVITTVTAVDPCQSAFVTAFPCGATRPWTSTLNPNRNGAIASTAIVRIGTGSAICLYASKSVDLIVDLFGHLEGSGHRLHPLEPSRLVDTRPGYHDVLGLPNGTTAPRSIMRIPVTGHPAVGSGAHAVSVNVAATGTAGDGYVSVLPGPCGATPSTSNLNYVRGETIANAAITRIGSDGTICVYNHGRSHLIVDLTGVVGGGSGGSLLRTSQNVRLHDSREAGGAGSGDLRVRTGIAGAPAGHRGVIVNSVALGNRSGYLSVRPCGDPNAPRTSTINHTHRPIANSAVARVESGALCVYRHVDAHVVVDAVAWLVP